MYDGEHSEVYTMHRTNIVLDEALVAEAFRYSKAKTKRDLIHEALSEFVAQRRRRDLSELRGKIRFADGFDHQRLRRSRAR
jgi:Arc/MetJ family transcription regulator